MQILSEELAKISPQEKQPLATLAELFEVDNIYVSRGVQNTANKGVLQTQHIKLLMKCLFTTRVQEIPYRKHLVQQK